MLEQDNSKSLYNIFRVDLCDCDRVFRFWQAELYLPPPSNLLLHYLVRPKCCNVRLCKLM